MNELIKQIRKQINPPWKSASEMKDPFRNRVINGGTSENPRVSIWAGGWLRQETYKKRSKNEMRGKRGGMDVFFTKVRQTNDDGSRYPSRIRTKNLENEPLPAEAETSLKSLSSPVQQRSLILPSSARVSELTYGTIVATRYPELDTFQNDIIQFGNYFQGIQCTRGGFLPIFWDAPYSYIYASTDIGEVVDWIRGGAVIEGERLQARANLNGGELDKEPLLRDKRRQTTMTWM